MSMDIAQYIMLFINGHFETIKFLIENKAKIGFDRENLERILIKYNIYALRDRSEIKV